MEPFNDKYHRLAEAVTLRCKFSNQKIVLTNGCFDLLHPGHVQALQEAANLGDQLWVAINDDDSIRQLKGPKRPIQNLEERASLLGALGCVSGIFNFHGTNLAREIELFHPDVYVKSGDYTLETLHPEERSALEHIGCKICFIPFLKGHSTTQLIDRILRYYS
ncbi:MAG: adenylyltransferase/cytidyltransferase family protein [Puniceicoccales bacterium]|jgi:rfaE bifunctional protein nucleotidyltransferase chain/domain|nr:adenylyltransferase/cytidyltransferase family protein [Puniceicoccales bacterium]